MSVWAEIVVGVFGLTFYGVVLGLLFCGVDRVLVARMQARLGPPVLQPFRDVAKLMHKQDMVPEHAVGSIYRLAPVVALAGAVSVLFYLPLGGLGDGVLAGRGDGILVLYLLLIPGLAMVLGGFASGSPYASIGAQREMVTMVSYELPLAAAILTFAWRLDRLGVADPFSLSAMSANPIWADSGILGILGALMLLATMLAVTPGELGRIPFDSAEAETELAGGILVEYSGRSLALFELAAAVKTVAMCGVLTAMFLPWNLSDWVAWPRGVAGVADLLFFMLKSGLLMFVGVSVVRAGMARFRITDVVKTYWKKLGVLALAGMGLVALDVIWQL